MSFLADELFQSTNPTCGSILAKTILKNFVVRNLFLLCATHHYSTLEIADIDFYAMENIQVDQTAFEQMTLDEIKELIPFKVRRQEDIDIDEVRKEAIAPLRLALHFPLNDEIKRELKQQIEDYHVES